MVFIIISRVLGLHVCILDLISCTSSAEKEGVAGSTGALLVDSLWEPGLGERGLVTSERLVLVPLFDEDWGYMPVVGNLGSSFLVAANQDINLFILSKFNDDGTPSKIQNQSRAKSGAVTMIELERSPESSSRWVRNSRRQGHTVVIRLVVQATAHNCFRG